MTPKAVSKAALALAMIAISPPLAAEQAEQAEDRDWADTLRKDAEALHNDIARNHPGPVNPEDPGFAARNDKQLALALARAKTAQSYSDYYYALRQYMSSFDDGHMGFTVLESPSDNFRWPGFATSYSGDGSITVKIAEPDTKLPIGARLVSCDGMSAEDYAAATLGKMWGRWMLESQRQRRGWMLFLDEGSKYIPQAKECTFTKDGREQVVKLQWQALPDDKLDSLQKQLTAARNTEFSAQTLPDGTRWFTLPSFNGSPASDAGKELPKIINGMKKDKEALAKAPAIVLDLRGNNGGSSDWSAQIGDIIFPPGAREALENADDDDTVVHWRASPANLAEIAKAYSEWRYRPNFSDAMDEWFREVLGGLGPAIARGDALWKHVPLDGEEDEEGESKNTAREEKPSARPAQQPSQSAGAAIFVLTDSGCASACLDAVDLWTALGATHIGRTTSADTLYMEVREAKLPSGLAKIWVPMKVYSGRDRGANQPAVPAHAYAGDITDTKALQGWITSLPEYGKD